MKLALIHLATRQTPEATVEAALFQLRQAHNQGAELTLLPELFSSGYRYPDAAKTPWVLDQLQAFAHQTQTVVGAGILGQVGSRYANRMHLLGPKGELATYTKTHLIPAFNEPETMILGEKLVALELGGFKAGLSICFDLRFPELYRAYALEGVTLFLVPSAWPLSRAYAWELLIKARAAENQAYLVAANHAEDPFGAASLAVDPMGQEMARIETEGFAIVELKPTYPIRLREEFPVLPQRRPELYEGLLKSPANK